MKITPARAYVNRTLRRAKVLTPEAIHETPTITKAMKAYDEYFKNPSKNSDNELRKYTELLYKRRGL